MTVVSSNDAEYMCEVSIHCGLGDTSLHTTLTRGRRRRPSDDNSSFFPSEKAS